MRFLLGSWSSSRFLGATVGHSKNVPTITSEMMGSTNTFAKETMKSHLVCELNNRILVMPKVENCPFTRMDKKALLIRVNEQKTLLIHANFSFSKTFRPFAWTEKRPNIREDKQNLMFIDNKAMGKAPCLVPVKTRRCALRPYKEGAAPCACTVKARRLAFYP